MIPFIRYFEPSSLNLIVVLHRADALRTSKREMAVATRGRISSCGCLGFYSREECFYMFVHKMMKRSDLYVNLLFDLFRFPCPNSGSN